VTEPSTASATAAEALHTAHDVPAGNADAYAVALASQSAVDAGVLSASRRVMEAVDRERAAAAAAERSAAAESTHHAAGAAEAAYAATLAHQRHQDTRDSAKSVARIAAARATAPHAGAASDPSAAHAPVQPAEEVTPAAAGYLAAVSRAGGRSVAFSGAVAPTLAQPPAYYVRVVYQGQPLRLPGQASEFVPLAAFQSMLQDLIPVDLAAECGVAELPRHVPQLNLALVRGHTVRSGGGGGVEGAAEEGQAAIAARSAPPQAAAPLLPAGEEVAFDTIAGDAQDIAEAAGEHAASGV